MIKEKLKTKAWDNLTSDIENLKETYAYPMFKKGDIVWVLTEGKYDVDSYDRYRFSKMVVSNGEPMDDDYKGWGYVLCDPEDFTTEIKDKIDYEYDYDYTPQIDMFTKLKDLKEFAKSKVEQRINSMKVQITTIDEFKDTQEYRDDQINIALDEA